MQINRVFLSFSSLTGLGAPSNRALMREQHQMGYRSEGGDSFVDNSIADDSLFSSKGIINKFKPSDYLDSSTPADSSTYLQAMKSRSRNFSVPRLAMMSLVATLALPQVSAETSTESSNLATLRRDQFPSPGGDLTKRVAPTRSRNKNGSSATTTMTSTTTTTTHQPSSSTVTFTQRFAFQPASTTTVEPFPLMSTSPVVVKEQQDHLKQAIANILTKANALPAQLFRLWHERVPQPLRFFISGNCGNVCFYYCEIAFSRMLVSSLAAADGASRLAALVASSQDSITFLGGYLAHIVAQHWLHAALVYGLDTINTPTKYFTTLRGMYQALLTSAVGSTLLNTLLVKFVPMLSKPAAFILTLWTFSAINYFWIGWIVKRSESQQTVA